MDSWIGRQSRLAASGSDSYHESREAAAPQWREDASDQYQQSYQPEDSYQAHEGRHARHRTHQQYEAEYQQYDGAYGQHEHAYGQPDPSAYPDPAYYEPDQTYQYGEHDQAYQEGNYAHEEYPDDDYAGRNEYRHVESDAQDPEAEDGWPGRKHNRQLGASPRPANRRRLWLIPVGALALGALLCALLFIRGSGRPPEGGLPVSAATATPDAFGEPTTLPEMTSTPPSSATSGNPTATPSATPSGTPSATPSATPSVTPSATPTPTSAAPTPTQTQNSGPVLLGPSSSRGVENMVQQHCDRHNAGSADPRSDGRWQCTRLLSASIVDMDAACRDRYDSGAYARTSNPGDPYAWRCYR